MDNELEIVNNEGMVSDMVPQKPGFLATYGPIIGGATAAVAVGTLLYFFVAKPLYAKYKAKKAAEAKPAEPADEPKAEE